MPCGETGEREQALAMGEIYMDTEWALAQSCLPLMVRREVTLCSPPTLTKLPETEQRWEDQGLNLSFSGQCESCVPSRPQLLHLQSGANSTCLVTGED